jgi:hypothetical protein
VGMIETSRLAQLTDAVLAIYKSEDPSKMFIDALVWSLQGMLHLGTPRDRVERMVSSALDRLQKHQHTDQRSS